MWRDWITFSQKCQPSTSTLKLSNTRMELFNWRSSASWKTRQAISATSFALSMTGTSMMRSRTRPLFQFRRLHHLHWEEGVTRYCASCISHHITHKFPRWHAATFMVLETATGVKLGFLKREFPQLNIVHAYNVTFSTLPEVVAMCLYRDHGKHCSFIKCCQMHKHFDF